MEWTPQILHDRIKQSAAVQAQQPKAWDWIDAFRQEKNAILLVFDVLRSCTDLDTFRLTVMVLKKIINGLISMLQNQDILAFIELLMNITTKVVITDKPTLNNLCYILARLATRSESNMVVMLFNHFKQSLNCTENTEFKQYYTIYLLNFLYESLTFLNDKHFDDENVLNQFKTLSQELLTYLEENRNEHFSLVVICFRLGIKLELFDFHKNQLYSNQIFLMLFGALINPSLVSTADLAALPVNIELILNKLRRRFDISNYSFFSSFYSNFLNVLLSGTQPAYSMMCGDDDDDEFVLNLYYMAYSVATIHEEEISQMLMQQSSSFEAIPVIEMTIYCLRNISVSKMVSCLSIWRDLLYLCRLKITSQKIEEWGSLQPNLLVSHYYIYYLKNIMSVVYTLSNDSENLVKGFFRLHQAVLGFFDRPPLKDEVIASFIVDEHIKPNAISVAVGNNSTPLTILNTKGFLGVAFMKPKSRHEFLPLMKVVIDNELYLLDNIYSNDPFLHMALIDLIEQSIELTLARTNGIDVCSVPIESYRLSTSVAMAYFLYLYGLCQKFSRSLYTKLVRCVNRLFTLDPNSFQLYLPEFLKIISNAYNDSTKKVCDVATDLLDQCVDFTCTIMALKCDIDPILLLLFTPHLEVMETALRRGKINKNALHFFKTAIEALDVKTAKKFYIQVVDKMLPAFLTILTSNIQEHEIIENTCSCLRRIIRDLGTCFTPYLEALTTSVRKAFETNFHPTYLYISSVVVDEFGHLASSEPRLADCINTLVVAMLDLALPHIFQFENQPSLDLQLQDHIDQCIEDFFVLIKRLLRFYPSPLFNYSKLETICEMGIKFLARNDNYTVNAVVSFWVALIEIALKSSVPAEKDTASKVLFAFSPKIVYTIMGEMVHHPIYSILDSYCDLLYYIKKCDPNLYLQSLNLTITQIRNDDHIPAHIAIVEEISKESLNIASIDGLVDICEKTLVKHA